MNLKFYIDKLKESEDYKKFIKENPKAYFCSAFFTVDKSGSDNKQHLDFFVPEKYGKIFSFYAEDGMKMVEVERNDGKIPEKMDFKVNFDFDELEKSINSKAEEERLKNKIEKLIFSLQKTDAKTALIGTIFLDKMALLKILYNIKTKKLEQFEKVSFFDMFKIVKQ